MLQSQQKSDIHAASVLKRSRISADPQSEQTPRDASREENGHEVHMCSLGLILPPFLAAMHERNWLIGLASQTAMTVSAPHCQAHKCLVAQLGLPPQGTRIARRQRSVPPPERWLGLLKNFKIKGSLGVPSRPVMERSWDSLILRCSVLRLTRLQVFICIGSPIDPSVLPWRRCATSLRSTQPSETWYSGSAAPSCLLKQTSSNIGITCNSNLASDEDWHAIAAANRALFGCMSPPMAQGIGMPIRQHVHGS